MNIQNLHLFYHFFIVNHIYDNRESIKFLPRCLVFSSFTFILILIINGQGIQIS